MRVCARRFACAWVLIASAGCDRLAPVGQAPPVLEIEFLGDANVRPGTVFDSLDGGELGGISAVLFREERGTWIGLSDARSESRFYELSVEYSEENEYEALRVLPLREHRLTDETGAPFPANVLDPEGIAPTPWGTLFVSTEADARSEPVHQPKILEIGLDGRWRRRFDVPEKFLVEGSPPARGVRHNLGFEALAATRDGETLFAGVEDTLLQDGPPAGFENPGFCRILELSVSSDEKSLVPSAEYVYPLGPFAAEEGFEEPEIFAGLVELVTLPDGRLLALERVFVRDRADRERSLNRVRIYAVDLSFATDVSAIETLTEDASWSPVRKELLIDLDDIVDRLSPGYRVLDNFEAMGLGPELPGGGRSLLVVSDDNFQETQRTAFLLFRLNLPPVSYQSGGTDGSRGRAIHAALTRTFGEPLSPPSTPRFSPAPRLLRPFRTSVLDRRGPSPDPAQPSFLTVTH